MATMTKAQLAAENAQLRAALEAMRSELNTLRAQHTPRVPDWQLAAQQRRAQYDAAVAAGRRVKFVGTQLVDY